MADLRTLQIQARLTALAANTHPGQLARNLALHAGLLEHRLPATITNLAAELDALDGYPTTASGADRGERSKGGVSRPTEHTAIIRLTATITETPIIDRQQQAPTRIHAPATETADLAAHLTDAVNFVAHAGRNRHDPADHLTLALIAIRNAHTICDRHGQPADPRQPDQLRCRGTGDGDNCRNVADFRIDDDGSIDEGDRRCLNCRTILEQREAEAVLAARRTRDAARKRRMRRFA